MVCGHEAEVAMHGRVIAAGAHGAAEDGLHGQISDELISFSALKARMN